MGLPEPPPLILVVDDDPDVVSLLRDFLAVEGLDVCSASDLGGTLNILRTRPIACVILDVMLPGADGFQIARSIREINETPILFLSAREGDTDKIRGLALGGDDFIGKTASPGEIVARVKAVLRRTRPSREDRAWRYGRLALDLTTREVVIDGSAVGLSPKEFDLLAWFCQNPRQVFTYQQLLDIFWGGVGDKHTVRVHAARIREKIERDPHLPELLVNVWGVGYRWDGVRS